MLAADDVEHIPGALRLTTRYDLSATSGYETFYRRSSGQPRVSRGNVGSDVGVGIASDEETILGTIGNERFRDFTRIGPSVLLATALAKVGTGDARLRGDRATVQQAGRDPQVLAEGPEPFRLEDAARGASPEYEVFRLRRL